jgi:hypothetical protein
MKLSTRDAAAYFKKPEPNASGCLIYGEDPCASVSSGPAWCRAARPERR